MDAAMIATYADSLYDADRTRKPIRPLTEQAPGITVDDAYGIQLKNVERVLKMGHTISGKKIGLTSPGIQRQLGVNEPDYGHLFAAMDCGGPAIATDELIQPKIEAEIAFVLQADLTGGNVTVEDVRRATAYVVGAFEIVDSRVEDWEIKLPDTIADNASSGRYILGEERIPLFDLDLASIAMRFYKGGELIDEGTGAAVLGDPCKAVAWLANRLYGYGVTLKKGEVILSGAFTAAPPAKKGDVFRADFSVLGSVEGRFV